MYSSSSSSASAEDDDYCDMSLAEEKVTIAAAAFVELVDFAAFVELVDLFDTGCRRRLERIWRDTKKRGEGSAKQGQTVRYPPRCGPHPSINDKNATTTTATLRTLLHSG